MQKNIIKIVAGLLLLFVVALQNEYEKAIDSIEVKCIYFKQRKRIHYTPVLVYFARYLCDKDYVKKDRLLYNKLTEDCSSGVDLHISGYHQVYAVHSFFSEFEKDSILMTYHIIEKLN